MKKLVLIAAFGTFTFLNAQAQEATFGIKAGVNFANLSVDSDDADPQSRTGFHVGGLVEIPVSEKFSVQPELLYSAQGAKSKETFVDDFYGNYTAETTLKLDYISLPVMAKYYVANGLALEAGPQFNFLVAAKGEYEVKMNGMSQSGEIDMKDQVKKIDIGLGFGGSYTFDMGLLIGARYNLGLTDANDAEVEPDAPNKIKNKVFQLSVGYQF